MKWKFDLYSEKYDFSFFHQVITECLFYFYLDLMSA